MKERIAALSVLVLLVAIGAGVLVYSRDAKSKTENSSQNPTTVDASKTDEVNNSASLACGVTSSTTEGPYYVTGTAQLVNGQLNYTGLSGDIIKISGYVYAGTDNTKPLANAKVDIWQADAGGNYHPASNGSVTKYNIDQIALRGYVLTDEKGYYEFNTIYPGEYEGRARHIHVRTMADGYTAVTSQLIMSKMGDATPAEEDSIASSLPACHKLTFTNGSATFDFRLQ